jgi:hypothetical protein
VFIPDSDFLPSRISDPDSRIQQRQKRGGEKISYRTFLVAMNLTKLKIVSFVEQIEKNHFYLKNCAKYGLDPDLDPKPQQKLFATGSGKTLVIALREQDDTDTVLNKY